jgi:hypothetical protein
VYSLIFDSEDEWMLEAELGVGLMESSRRRRRSAEERKRFAPDWSVLHDLQAKTCTIKKKAQIVICDFSYILFLLIEICGGTGSFRDRRATS